MSHTIAVRPARPADAPVILALLRQLAQFEQAPDGVSLTEEVIRADAFGEHPRFLAYLGEVEGDARGLMIVYLAYSSWAGKPTLVVHDLFVEASARGSGLGRALLKSAAALACDRDCCRVDVNVLAWNEKARGFYQSLGFAPLENWLPYRLDGQAMQSLAKE
ncbi:GNAT family N-acetyltransferase [Telmatospirillum sp.]|uniref:GNAT family N-acetyltransferase n=1 Tax=Telmatospirillum sp. TaxID=2079197 RepID=UPI0028447340|nr:GNAT family N-acetyltransferase [Telmatospirillum sp.]MDR3440152.1 GNAT family N-acetyltransferase [Telmatospirillum sp.]